MKKNILSIIACLLFFPGLTQITVTSDNIIGAGAIVVNGIDTTTQLTPGSGGANQSWDFTSVIVQDYDTMWFMNPNQTPYPDAYPAANLAARIYQEEMYVYFNSNAQELALLGGVWIESITIPPVIAPIIPKEVLAAFPMNYLDNYMESFVQEIKFPTPEVLSMDSIWIKIYTDKTTIVDAWGTIATPLGAFEVLRVRENTSTTDSIFAFMMAGWMFVDTESNIDEVYSWWTDDASVGFPVVELNVDTGTGLPDDIFFLTQEPVYGLSEPVLEGFTMVLFPNPCSAATRLRYLIHDPSTTLGTGSGYLIFDLYSISGVRIERLMAEEKVPGEYEMEIDVSDLPDGLYIVRLQAGNDVRMQKLVVIH
ncbi:MAG: T9SS type A sorting domain-containing protein [Bacteroidota bacterium]|nr:T9SS type A sorting domain-containing protein [Bacteroidota bacterium]